MRRGFCTSVLFILSVKRHLTSRMSNRAINKSAHSLACEPEKICGDFSKTTTFVSYGAKHERKSQYANYLAYHLSHYPARRTSQRQSLGYPGPAYPAFFRTMHADGASPCWSENWHQPASWTLYDNKRTRKRMHQTSGGVHRAHSTIRAVGRRVANFCACVLIKAPGFALSVKRLILRF